MDSSINLISPKNEQLEREQRHLMIARTLAFSVMLMVAAAAVLIFVVNFTLPINSIKNEENTTLSNISPLHKKLVQYYLVKDRINNLSNIISQRKNLPDALDSLINLIPSELSVSSISVDSKQLALTVTGQSLLPMNKFIDDLTALSMQDKLIKNLSVQQLSVDVKTAKYTVSVQADMQ